MVKKLFKSVFVVILTKLVLVMVVIVGRYFIYLSCLGKQISQLMHVGEDKMHYTPSDILKQTIEIAERAQRVGKNRQGLPEELTKQSCNGNDLWTKGLGP